MKRGGKEGIVKLILIALVILIISSLIVSAEVVIFDKYDSVNTLEDGKLHVKRDIRIKNVGSNPIIPGELHFKIYEVKNGVKSAPDVTGFVVKAGVSRDLDTRKVQTDKEVNLVVNVWDPLLPNFYFDFVMEYDINFRPKGLLFYELVVPKEDTTISIKKSNTDFLIPKSKFITYAPNADISTEGKYRVVSWQDEENMVIEYSIIPFPNIGIKAVNIFWIFMIAVFMFMLVFRLVKNRL